jgi:hypothetical protein
MYLQELLEVAIGLVFVYLLLSLVCMQVQEWLASYLRWRADNLEDGLREMLADEALTAGWRRMRRKIPILKQFLKPEGLLGWVDTLYAHPLIKSLAQPGTKPSYIPARNFAQVLFDMVMTAGTEASVIQQTLLALRAEIQNYSNLGMKDRKAFEEELNNAIAQAGKIIDLSRPGKIEFGNYDSLRSEAWSELKRHLANLGVKTAENWEEHPETPIIFDNTLLNSFWPHVDVKQVLKPIFKEMTQIITEIRKIPPLELSVQSPSKDLFDKPSLETERLIRRGVAALLV